MCLWPLLLAPDTVCGSVREYDLPAFFGPVITGEQRQLKFVVRLRVLPGQREPALPASFPPSSEPALSCAVNSAAVR